MIVKGKFLGVEMRQHKDKKSGNNVEVADVIFQFSQPTKVFISTLWNHSVVKQDHKPYAAMVGIDCYFAVKEKYFNGEICFDLVTSVLPQPVEKLAAVSERKTG